MSKPKPGVASLIGRPLLAGALAAAGAVSSGAAVAASDIFLKLDDVKGESQDAKHKDEIEILFYSQLFRNSGASRFGGGGAGRVTCGDITVQKTVDKSTPALIHAVTTGQHFKTGVITFRKAGGNTDNEYFVVTISDVLIDSIQQTDVLPDKIVEKVTLNAAKFEFNYRTQDEKGVLGPAQTYGYDCRANKAL